MAAKVRTGKKPEEPPRGTPAYMLTYGDMCTLMMCFFIFLFNPGKANDTLNARIALSSFRQSMGVFPRSIAVLRADQVLLVPKEHGTKNFWGTEKNIESLERMLRKQIEEMQNIGPGYITYTRGKKELHVTIGSQALFDSGSAEIRPEFTATLDKISNFIKTNHLLVTVEGHTDDRPISNPVFPSNWELSVGRASRIIRYMHDKHGIPNNMLSASGYADTRPVATNATPEGRQKNRRIEIILKPTDKTPINMPEAAQDLFGGAKF